MESILLLEEETLTLLCRLQRNLSNFPEQLDSWLVNLEGAFRLSFFDALYGETSLDLDISRNGLSQSKQIDILCMCDYTHSFLSLRLVPGCIYRMENLKRLNASHNAISELSGRVGEPQRSDPLTAVHRLGFLENWVMLELLNLSYNKLQELPV